LQRWYKFDNLVNNINESHDVFWSKKKGRNKESQNHAGNNPKIAQMGPHPNNPKRMGKKNPQCIQLNPKTPKVRIGPVRIGEKKNKGPNFCHFNTPKVESFNR